MAKTKRGKKIVRVIKHKHKPPGGKRKTVSVKRHCRSEPD